MDHLPTKMYCDQFERVRIYFVNLSNDKPIGNLKIASNGIATSKICFRELNKREHKLKLNQLERLNKNEFKYKDTELANAEKLNKQPFVTNSELVPNTDMIYSLDNVTINPNGVYELDMWIRGPNQPGDHKFYFMFFYQEVGVQEVVNSSSTFKYLKLLVNYLNEFFIDLTKKGIE